MENNNFQRLVNDLAKGNNFALALQQANQRYLIKSYKISDFTPIIVVELYANLQQKFYLRRTKPNQEGWFENQLRIFIWLLIGYLHIHGKSLEKMTQIDWEYFVPIFNHRSYTFFEYQSIALFKHTHKSPKWTPEEAAMLEQIIEYKNYKNKWNSIARELYNRSNKKFYRNPKQCREQWMNHLDPVKLHSQWTANEDLTLLTTVKACGKKWSMVAKKLMNTRTEHMVKNRYKSLISNELKKHPHLRQTQIESMLISKIQEPGILIKEVQSKKNDNMGPTLHNILEEKQMEQGAKSQKYSLRKGSSQSEADDSMNSPGMIQLNESDFHPLPLPFNVGAIGFGEDDSSM